MNILLYVQPSKNCIEFLTVIDKNLGKYKNKGVRFTIKKVVSGDKKRLINNGITVLPAAVFNGKIITGPEEILRSLESPVKRTQDKPKYDDYDSFISSDLESKGNDDVDKSDLDGVEEEHSKRIAQYNAAKNAAANLYTRPPPQSDKEDFKIQNTKQNKTIKKVSKYRSETNLDPEDILENIQGNVDDDYEYEKQKESFILDNMN